MPGASSVRIEIAKDSDLPVKLAELGWNPIQCSSGTRITGRGLMPVDVIEITLGK